MKFTVGLPTVTVRFQPAAEGRLSLKFLLPVFAVTTGNTVLVTNPPPREERPSLATVLDAVTSAPTPPATRPPTHVEQDEVFVAANITRTARPGAVRDEAWTMDPEAVSTAGKLTWLGYPMAALFTAIFAFFLLAIPIIGWLLAFALVGYVAYSMIRGLRELLRRRKGPETVWVDDNVVHVEDVTGRIERIPRTAIDRIEVVPVGSVGTAQYFSLIAAGPPNAGNTVRPRKTLVEAVRTREAARTLGMCLSTSLREPHPPVVNAERGMEYVEKLSAWAAKRNR